MNDLTRRYAVAETAWGDHEPEPSAWSSGPWYLELRGDELADIRFDGAIVLRAVRAVARDRDWSTVPASVTSVGASESRLTVGVRLVGLGADIVATLSIEADGAALTVSFAGESHTDFDRNRLGLVVLHPPSVASERLVVVSPDGARIETAFPQQIAPHQPALNIARLEWRADGLAASLDFAGDVFEMEDQRNWTDASFKTYSTPLSLPFPVRVAAGERVEQSVVLRCERIAQRARPEKGRRVRFAATGHAFPSIAVGASTAPDPAPRRVHPPASAVLVELETATSNWRAALARAAEDALPLDVRIVTNRPDDLDPVLDALRPLDVVRLGVFSTQSQVTEPNLWTALVAGVAARGMRVDLVGGARSHFTELNRTHTRLPGNLPGLAFSVTPQMHANERAQLVESIAMQRAVAQDAARIAAGRPVHIGPITLRSRYNAVATTSPRAVDAADLVAGYGAQLVAGATDSRQRSSALAAWTIASAAALAIPGVASLTYFEGWGPRGLVDVIGTPFPVADAIGWLHELADLPILVPESSLPDGVWGVGGEIASGRVLLLANLRSEPTQIEVEGDSIRLEPLTAVRHPLL